MSRTVAWDGVLETGDRSAERPDEGAFRAFLQSWKWGAFLAAACALGLVAIFATHPFASRTVSERVSAAVGQTVSCSTAGVAVVGGNESTVYRCAAGAAASGRTVRSGRCFTVSGREVKQVVGNRGLAC